MLRPRDSQRIPVVAKGSANATFFQGPPAQVQVPGRMLCFCLEVFVVGHVAREFITGQDKVVGRVDGVEIVDVKPDGLEANMECYIRTLVTLFLRQKLAIAWKTFFVDFPLLASARCRFHRPPIRPCRITRRSRTMRSRPS